MNTKRVCYLSVALAALIAITARRVATAQDSEKAPPRPAAAKSADFYRLDEVQSVHLRVAEEDLRRMLAALPRRIYVPASFRWRDISIRNAAIRFKGNSSSAPEQGHKRSFLVKFDEYEADQRFLGLRRASFDNGVQFGSVFSEPIITEILREEGVTTHRSNYAKLFLNDEYRGVYVNVERLDESFLDRSLPDPDGMLFKVDEGGPGANLQYLGPDPSAYERTLEPETKSAKAGRRRLVEFIEMIDRAPNRDFAERLDSEFETDEFLRVMAVMLFSGAFDQLTGWNPHNYSLYYGGKPGRWRYLPWDLDVGFAEVAFGHIHVLDGWNAAWPAPGQMPNPLLDRIVSDPDLLGRYRVVARRILGEHFEPDRLCAVIDARYEMIKADLLADPFPHRRVTNAEDRSYDDIVASMKQFVRKRHALARKQLDDPGKRPEVVRRAGGPMQLAAKIRRVEEATRELQRAGKDVLPIQKLMRRIGPLLDKGRVEEAEKLLDEAHDLTGDGPGKE